MKLTCYSTIEDVDRLFRCYNVDMNKWHLQKSPYSSIFNLFFLLVSQTSPCCMNQKNENLGEVACLGPACGEGPISMVWSMGKFLSFPNFQSLTISQLLMGPKPQQLGGFFFGGFCCGGSRGNCNPGIWFFWSGFFFVAFKCCSLVFFLTHWFESMATTVMIIHFLTVPAKISDLKGILGSYVFFPSFHCVLFSNTFPKSNGSPQKKCWWEDYIPSFWEGNPRPLLLTDIIFPLSS